MSRRTTPSSFRPWSETSRRFFSMMSAQRIFTRSAMASEPQTATRAASSSVISAACLPGIAGWVRWSEAVKRRTQHLAGASFLLTARAGSGLTSPLSPRLRPVGRSHRTPCHGTPAVPLRERHVEYGAEERAAHSCSADARLARWVGPLQFTGLPRERQKNGSRLLHQAQSVQEARTVASTVAVDYRCAPCCCRQSSLSSS